MGIVEINLKNAKLGDEAKLMPKVVIESNNDVKVNVTDIELNGKAVVLENVNIESVLKELGQKAEQIDRNSKEYLEVQEILSVEQGNNKNVTERIKKHISEFSKGVLASIVANMLT